MTLRQTLKLDLETELPPLPVAGHDVPLNLFCQVHMIGTVDSEIAAKAFDPQGQMEARALARTIKDNMRGWLRYYATEVCGELLGRPQGDPLEPLSRPSMVGSVMQERLSPVFAPWSYHIERLEVGLSVTESTMRKLPESLRRRLASAEAEADTAAAFGPFTTNVTEMADTVVPPALGQPVVVSVSARAIYTAHPERCRAALDQQAQLSPVSLGKALSEAVKPWIAYAAKQALYNTLFDAQPDGYKQVQDAEVMRTKAMDLCRQALDGLGVLHADLQVTYAAGDDMTMAALGLPREVEVFPTLSSGQSFDEEPQGESWVREAAKSVSASVELPPIEDAFWRHQKSISKKNTELSRRDLNRLVLQQLDRDGYPLEDRRRVGRQIGMAPEDLP